VTGANRGIGREVARQLAEADYTVLLAARDEDKARAAAGELPGDVRALELDVADPASIAFAAGRVEADPGSLDVLVNNGGVGTDFGVAGTEPDFEAMQQALETNFFGAYRLTVALLACSAAASIPEWSTCRAGWAGSPRWAGSRPATACRRRRSTP